MNLSDKEIKWLRLCAGSSVMYEGLSIDMIPPRRLKRFREFGLIDEYAPHNPIHKPRAKLSQSGREYLESL